MQVRQNPSVNPSLCSTHGILSSLFTMWKAALLTMSLLVALVDRVQCNEDNSSFYGVKLCGREFIRAVIFTCGGSRWRRNMGDQGKSCLRIVDTSCLLWQHITVRLMFVWRFTLLLLKVFLQKKPSTNGPQMPSLSLAITKIQPSPKHGETAQGLWRLWRMGTAAQLALPSQRTYWRRSGVQTGKDEMWWSDCLTHAANGAAARVKSVLCVKTLSPVQNSTLSSVLPLCLKSLDFYLFIYLFSFNYTCISYFQLIQDCDTTLKMWTRSPINFCVLVTLVSVPFTE